jgi:transposase
VPATRPPLRLYTLLAAHAVGRRLHCRGAHLGPGQSRRPDQDDRRDAEKLARLFRGGDLTPVWVPDAAHEALRDLVRAREAAKRDQLRARQRLNKFLLRHGQRPPSGVKPWTERFRQWVAALRFEHPAQEATRLNYVTEVEHARDRITRLEQAIDAAIAAAPVAMRTIIAALQALRGIAKVSAATIVAEVGPLSRFDRPRHLMAYSGAVPREDSSGPRTRRGRITKTGNAHLRRVVIEAAWAYQHRPHIGPTLRARQQHLSEPVKAIARKAQHRLHSHYQRLRGRGKVQQHVITAIGRELLGFVWAIGIQAEHEQVAITA